MLTETRFQTSECEKMVPPLIIVGAMAAVTLVGGLYAYNVSKGKAKAEVVEAEGKKDFWAGMDEQMPLIIGVIGILVTVAVAVVMYFKTKE